MAESSLSPALRKRFSAIAAAPPAPRVPLGVERLDGLLGGGLARGRLHELWPADADDLASATGVALMLALKAAGRTGAIVWIAQEDRRTGRLYPPGLAELGADPARLLFVTVADEAALLRAGADVVRSAAAGAAVIAPVGAARGLDLTATRRLTLFAERSGVTAILLRPRACHEPSAAATRWRVAAAPSAALAADAPGHPAVMLDLVRQRGGPPAPGWRLEWRRDEAGFAPLPQPAPAVAGGGCMAA